MTEAAAAQTLPPLAGEKFRDLDQTADGARRARVSLTALKTLWINTGTLCNITCKNCYIESSPKNDQLVYITLAEVLTFFEEIAIENLPVEEIGFTGGEPFMNPDIIPMLGESLARGFRVLVLTNAMKPMMRHRAALLDLKNRHREYHREHLVIRLSLDHYTPALHEKERGEGTWAPALEGLRWLSRNGFALHLAGRTCWNEDEASLRAGYARLFAENDIPIDATDPVSLVLFPEMDSRADVPEITEKCWDVLNVSPDDMMCATSRMVVKRKHAAAPAVLACTLIAYDAAFELGDTLKQASTEVVLNHPHCARFCVLGGGACSR